MREAVREQRCRRRRSERADRSDEQRAVLERLPCVIDDRERRQRMRTQPLLHQRSHSLGGLREKRKLTIVRAFDGEHRRSARGRLALYRRRRQAAERSCFPAARSQRGSADVRRSVLQGTSLWRCHCRRQSVRPRCPAMRREGWRRPQKYAAVGASPLNSTLSRRLTGVLACCESFATDRRKQRAVLQEELRRCNRKPQHVSEAAQRDSIRCNRIPVGLERLRRRRTEALEPFPVRRDCARVKSVESHALIWRKRLRQREDQLARAARVVGISIERDVAREEARFPAPTRSAT